jgi:HEAT repeat protein
MIMGLFGPPDIEKLKAQGDINGLLNALGYRRNSNAQKDMKIRGDAVVALIQLTKDPNKGADVEKTLLKMGSSATLVLIQASADSYEQVRRYSVSILGNLIDKSKDVVLCQQAVGLLIARLKSEDVDEVRANILFAMGGILDIAPELIPHDEVVPLLNNQLQDKNNRVRLNAVYCLVRLPDPRSVGPLIECLKDSDATVRNNAAATLGKIGDVQSVGPLVDALGDGEDKVRESAAGALGKIGASAVVPLISELKIIARAPYVSNALAQIGLPAVASLILEFKNESSASYAKSALIKIGVPAGPLLIQALADSNEQVRRYSASTLGNLIEESKDSELCKQAIEPLILRLKSKESNEVLKSVLFALNHAVVVIPDVIPRNEVVHLLLDCLQNQTDDMVRQNAAYGLYPLAEPSMISYLIESLKDPYVKVRNNVAAVLGKIGLPAVEPLALTLKDETAAPSAQNALVKIGTPACSLLIQALSDPDEQVRRYAAGAIGDIVDKDKDPEFCRQVVQPLAARLEDTSERVQTNVILALSKIFCVAPDLLPNIDVITHLIAHLNNQFDTTDRNAIDVLTQFIKESKDKNLVSQAVGALIAQLKDENEDVRNRATSALRNVMKESPSVIQWDHAIRLTIKCLSDACETVRGNATYLLGQLIEHNKDVDLCKQAAGPLIERLTDGNENVRISATYALDTILEIVPNALPQDKGVKLLIGCLGDKNDAVRQNAAYGLGLLPDPRSVEPLIGCLNDSAEKVRNIAIEALCNIQQPETIKALMKALFIDEKQVRQNVIKALGKMEIQISKNLAPCCGFCNKELISIEDVMQTSGRWILEFSAVGADVKPGNLGYQCTICGKVFCKACLEREGISNYLGGKSCPKCRGTFDYYHAGAEVLSRYG